MKVLYCSSEAVPFAASGGLGDVAGSLPAALCEEGVEVRVVMPLYGQTKEKYADQLEYVTNFNVLLGWRTQYCGVFRLEKDGVGSLVGCRLRGRTESGTTEATSFEVGHSKLRRLLQR